MKLQVAILGLVVAGLVRGQAPGAPPEAGRARTIEIQRVESGPPGDSGNATWTRQGGFTATLPAEGHFEFLTAETMTPGKPVKGVPYTAEGVSETVRILADGTRIKRSNSKKFARDSQGRTREEVTLSALGPWASAGEAMRMVHIFDPVAKVLVVLNEKDKTATKVSMREGLMPGGRAVFHRQSILVGGGGTAVGGAVAGGGGGSAASTDVVMIRRAGGDGVKEESLPRQTMEGVMVDGKRITHTIPAGEIGNDRAIETVTESWFSPELQVTVRSHTKDPQFGETDYRLSGLRRAEPAASLFEIPADYTVKEGPASGRMTFERRVEKK